MYVKGVFSIKKLSFSKITSFSPIKPTPFIFSLKLALGFPIKCTPYNTYMFLIEPIVNTLNTVREEFLLELVIHYVNIVALLYAILLTTSIYMYVIWLSAVL